MLPQLSLINNKSCFRTQNDTIKAFPPHCFVSAVSSCFRSDLLPFSSHTRDGCKIQPITPQKEASLQGQTFPMTCHPLECTEQLSPISGAFFYFLHLHTKLHTSTNCLDFIFKVIDSSSSLIRSFPAAFLCVYAQFPANCLRLTLAVTILMIVFCQFNNNMTCQVPARRSHPGIQSAV